MNTESPLFAAIIKQATPCLLYTSKYSEESSNLSALPSSAQGSQRGSYNKGVFREKVQESFPISTEAMPRGSKTYQQQR